MKRILLTLVCALMLLTGCNNSKTNNETKSDTVEEVQTNESINNEQEIVEETKQEEPVVENNDSIIRDSTKEALDAYEEFVDEYCAFMVKYKESNGTDISLLADYAKFLAKTSEMSKKMDDLEEELNNEELKYYTEVMLRCEQKMLDVATD